MADVDLDDPALESEVFQIDDFTVITPLEMLVSQLEMTIHDWGLGKNTHNNNFVIKKDMSFCVEWDSRTEKIALNDNHALNLTHYWPKNLLRSEVKEIEEAEVTRSEDDCSYFTDALKSISCRELDFMPGCIITSQFGVLEFLLLTPYIWSNDVILDEDQLNFVKSAVEIALSNVDCDMPAFVQFGTFDRHIYMGVSQNDSVRTEFLTGCVARQLPRHSNIDGLKEIFLDRLKISYDQKINATISVMIDFSLKEKLDRKLQTTSSAGDVDETSPENLFMGSTTYLSFGAVSDPVEKLCISAVWTGQNLRWFDESYHTKWDPFEAPAIYAFVNFHRGIPCALQQCLKSLLNASSSTKGDEKISSLLEKAGYSEANFARNALASLATPQTISITNPAGVDLNDGLDQASIFRWIDAIFVRSGSSSIDFTEKDKNSASALVRTPGGAVKQSADGPTESSFSEMEESDSNFIRRCLSLLENTKSAPYGSLTARIATALTHFLKLSESGTLIFAQMWYAIVQELRDKWETNQLLPGIDSPYTPDHRTCRLHQKLQMLQCCIDSRRRRHQKFEENSSTDQNGEKFFDAEDWLSEDSENGDFVEDINKKTSTSFSGRNRQLDMHLIEHPEIPIYEPFLQERCPMTEDMLEDYTNYLTSMKSPEHRAKAQLDPLRSDMQAFKAANPDCIFEDFIRWHSPRDFVIDETGKEGLSNRMKNENNVWLETWNDAFPLPIKYQKRLFNESKEAESILQEFSSLSVSDLAALLLPVVFKNASKQLLDECAQRCELVHEKMIPFLEKVSSCTRSGDPELYLDALRELNVMETTISQYSALWARFSNSAKEDISNRENANKLRDLAQKLVETSQSSTRFEALSGGEASIRCMVQFQEGDKLNFVSRVMQKLFSTDIRLKKDDANAAATEKVLSNNAESPMPPHDRKQYIFRCQTSLPSIGSRSTPQRMYVSIPRKGHFRMGIAITEDIVLQ